MSVSPRVFISCWCVEPCTTTVCDSSDRFCTSPMSCTSRMRWPPTSKLCGDSNSSRPEARAGARAQAFGIAVVAAEHAGQRHVRILERLENERRAEVAGVQHHAHARRRHLTQQFARSRVRGRANRPSGLRASLPPVWVVDLAPHEIFVRFPFGDHGEPVAVHQHFGRPPPAVVVRCHHRSRRRRRRTRRAGRPPPGRPSRGRGPGNRRSRTPGPPRPARAWPSAGRTISIR